MDSEILFLTIDDVLESYAFQIEAHGGDCGIRDPGLLESAVAQPQASFSAKYLHAFPFEIAAAYLYHLVKNHPFVDGNGRIGRVLMNHQLLRAGMPPVIVRARSRRTEYYPALDVYSRTDRHDEMTRLLALLVLEALRKRIALLTSPDVISLAQWARSADMRGNVAANRAKRQTLPAFRMRDRWMIAADYR